MTARSPGPSAQFLALLSRFPPKIVAQARRSLTGLRRALPGALQLVYDYGRSLVVAFSPSERGYEAPVALAIDARGLRLYLPKDLPDPGRRLRGSGSKVRSVVLQDASDLERGEVGALLRAAIQRFGATLPRARPTRMVIKSTSRKKGPGGTGRA